MAIEVDYRNRIISNNNVVRDTDFAPEDPQVDRVTETDLAKLFDITPRQLVDTRWVVERYVGTEQKEPLVFDGVSSLRADFPITVNALGSFSGTFTGGWSWEAAFASDP